MKYLESKDFGSTLILHEGKQLLIRILLSLEIG